MALTGHKSNFFHPQRTSLILPTSAACLHPLPGELLLILRNPTQMCPISGSPPCYSVAEMVLPSCFPISQDTLLLKSIRILCIRVQALLMFWAGLLL